MRLRRRVGKSPTLCIILKNDTQGRERKWEFSTFGTFVQRVGKFQFSKIRKLGASRLKTALGSDTVSLCTKCGRDCVTVHYGSGVEDAPPDRICVHCLFFGHLVHSLRPEIFSYTLILVCTKIFRGSANFFRTEGLEEGWLGIVFRFRGIFVQRVSGNFFTMYNGKKFRNWPSKYAFGPGFACDFCRIIGFCIANAVSHWCNSIEALDSLVQNGGSFRLGPPHPSIFSQKFAKKYETTDSGGFSIFFD